jgi:pimeloyl-ACP methyl ester carboxylesterase
MPKRPLGDVVVLLPGILGSVLARDGKDVWAPSPGAIGKALWTLGRSVESLELADDPVDADDLGDGVVATRLMPDIHIVPGLWGIDGYSGIKDVMLERFDLVPGESYLELPYDWRRDNRVAARRLQRLAEEKLAARRQDNPDAKLILIGHSMGGLVARHYLECMDGWKDARALNTFGTPHRGSLNALDFLANGFVKKLGPLKLVDLSRLLRSLTSVYQLLPTYPCVDLGDGDITVEELAGRVDGVDEVKAAAAAEFHRAITAGAGRHDPGVYDLHSIVGTSQATKQSARWDGGRLLIEERRGGRDEGGDGTVPRLSATPPETDDWMPRYQPMYSADRHASLQNADPVQTQLFGILTQPALPERAFGSVNLLAEELLAVDEPLVVRGLHDVGGLTLALAVTDLATGRTVGGPVAMRRDADDVHHAELAPLPPGDYRLEVAAVGDSEGLVDDVHGLVCVVSDAEPDR